MKQIKDISGSDFLSIVIMQSETEYVKKFRKQSTEINYISVLNHKIIEHLRNLGYEVINEFDSLLALLHILYLGEIEVFNVKAKRLGFKMQIKDTANIPRLVFCYTDYDIHKLKELLKGQQ